MTIASFPRFSVVVPTYNRASIICETLESIFNQVQQPHEVIVVDDGSTDTTQLVLAGYNDCVRSIQITNSGDLVARNTGLLAATGDLVAFCDSDDLWQPDHLASMLRFWSLGAGPIAAFADFQEVRNGQWSNPSKFAGAPTGYWHDAESVGPEHALLNRPFVCDLLRFQPFFPSCMVVDRARFLAIGGWDEGVSRMVGCDFATALRIAEHPPIGVLRQPTVGIRKHAGNFSGDVLRMNLGDADVLEYVLATRASLNAYRAEILKSIDSRRLSAFDTAFAAGNFDVMAKIKANLSAPLSPAQSLKAKVGELRDPLRSGVWRALTWAGGRRARQ